MEGATSRELEPIGKVGVRNVAIGEVGPILDDSPLADNIVDTKPSDQIFPPRFSKEVQETYSGNTGEGSLERAPKKASI